MSRDSSPKDPQPPDRLVMRRSDDRAIAPLIENAKARGWKRINVNGHAELRRAVWIEATMNGIEVTGYAPTAADCALIEKLKRLNPKAGGPFVLKAEEVLSDYSDRVIPQLQTEYESLKRARSRAGVRTTELDRTYGINLPAAAYRELDDRFFRTKGALLRAIEVKEYFRSLGNKTVKVEHSYEDGVARFVTREQNGTGMERTYCHAAARDRIKTG